MSGAGIVETCVGWAKSYEGTPAALLAAGVLTPELLPGAVGQHKTTARGTLDGRGVRVRRSTRGRLLAFVEYSEDEQEALRASWARERDEQTAEKRVASLPTSAEGYRHRALGLAGVLLRSAGDLTAARGGYAFDEATVSAIEDLLDEVSELVATAKIQYSPARRWEEEARIHVTSVAESEKRGSRWARIMEKRPAD